MLTMYTTLWLYVADIQMSVWTRSLEQGKCWSTLTKVHRQRITEIQMCILWQDILFSRSEEETSQEMCKYEYMLQLSYLNCIIYRAKYITYYIHCSMQYNYALVVFAGTECEEPLITEMVSITRKYSVCRVDSKN